MPSGCTAFCYYRNGQLVDEIDVAPADAPPRPTTVPQALQKQMPLAEVLPMLVYHPHSGCIAILAFHTFWTLA